MLETWLIPICLFWGISALYFGGLGHEVKGASGALQFIGLILAYVLFVVIWAVAHRYVLPDSGASYVAASVIAIILFPVAIRLGYLLVGGRIYRPAMPH
ncbi:MAG TPA: hypothetical protein VLT79_01880 [Gemmatimonadales bacterium]|nr:hypothetical protein [Gemmatimonadales bacterium]